MRKFLPIFTVLFLLSITVFSQFKLGILGSSTAEGTGASPASNSWVNKLTAYYTSQGVLTETVNMAVGGTNPYHAMPDDYIPPDGRPATNLLTNVTAMIEENPDVVIVSFASNQFNIYTIDEIKFTLDSIRAALVNEGIKVYITTTQPRTSFNAAGRARLAELKDLILTWYGPFAINFFDDLADPDDLSILPAYRYSGDNIHINNAGHDVLFQNVLEADIFDLAMPVKLKDFYLNVRESQPELVWNVSDEEEDTRYAIEVSSDGKNFNETYSVKGKGITGEITYSYRPEIVYSTNYFRLRINERNRQFYSEILKYNRSYAERGVKVFPNPATHRLEIILMDNQSAGLLRLVNSAGKIIIQKNISAGEVNLGMEVNSISKGMYFLQVITPHRQHTQTVVIY